MIIDEKGNRTVLDSKDDKINLLKKDNGDFLTEISQLHTLLLKLGEYDNIRTRIQHKLDKCKMEILKCIQLWK